MPWTTTTSRRATAPAGTNAYAAWVARFERAFEAAGCHLGAGHDADIRPDFNGDPKLVGLVPGLGAGIMPLGQRRWAVEGLLLACWLSLQPGVDQVEYHPGGSGGGCLLRDSGSVNEALNEFLSQLMGT